MLLIERLPLVAQFLDFGRELRCVQRRRRGGLGALAQLNACVLLPERFPALELRQLRNEPAHPLRRRLRQQAGIGLPGPDLVRGGAGSLQLAGVDRLLGGVQQIVNLLPHRIRFVFRRVNLCQPTLLDHDQRGFEAPRQRAAFEWPDSTPANVPADSHRRWTCRRQAARLRRQAPRRWARASSSCVHSSIRCCASFSFACAARSSYLAASSRSAPSSVRRPASISGVEGGSCTPIHSLSRRSNRARVRCSSCSRSKRACNAWRAASERATRSEHRRRCPAPANGD